jgi:hypothetical protein
LNGHAFDAWFWRDAEPIKPTDDVDCFMWLRDSLSERFPGARILIYGYNANTVSDVSTGRLRTFGETFLERLLLEREHDAVGAMIEENESSTYDCAWSAQA